MLLEQSKQPTFSLWLHVLPTNKGERQLTLKILTISSIVNAHWGHYAKTERWGISEEMINPLSDSFPHLQGQALHSSPNVPGCILSTFYRSAKSPKLLWGSSSNSRWWDTADVFPAGFLVSFCRLRRSGSHQPSFANLRRDHVLPPFQLPKQPSCSTPNSVMLTYKYFLLRDSPDTNVSSTECSWNRLFRENMISFVSSPLGSFELQNDTWKICEIIPVTKKATELLLWFGQPVPHEYFFANWLYCWRSFPALQSLCTNHLLVKSVCLQDIHPALGIQKEPPASCCLRTLRTYIHIYIYTRAHTHTHTYIM